MREGARQVWELFTEKTKKKIRQNIVEIQDRPRNEPTQAPREEARQENMSDKIARIGKQTRLETTMKLMKESQTALEKSTTACQAKIQVMQKTTEDNMEKMSDMINKMGESITIQNRQLEAQAKAQVKQAEDIEIIMKAIQAISKAVQVTPTTTQHEEETDDMQVDIADSNNMKRKQTSIELTTLFAEETQASTMTSSTTAGSQFKGMHSTGRQ